MYLHQYIVRPTEPGGLIHHSHATHKGPGGFYLVRRKKREKKPGKNEQNTGSKKKKKTHKRKASGSTNKRSGQSDGKVCDFCFNCIISPDPINGSKTLRWGRPGREGNQCYFCRRLQRYDVCLANIYLNAFLFVLPR